MKQINCLFLFFFLFSLAAFSQKNGSVKGVAYDTLAKKPLAGATITLLAKKDSSLVSFTMSDNQGRFELTGIPVGEYRLLITHVNYRNTNKFFAIAETNKNISLNNVVMNDKAKLLDEVLVQSEAPPVTLIGDTVQYNAGSF